MAEPPPNTHSHDPGEEEKKPRLDPLEEDKARQEESLDQKITYDVIRREGDKELERPLSALWWAAVAGGLSMGFSFVAEALILSHLPDADWRPLLTMLGYPVGFLIITLGSQQLFTENTVTPIVPFMVNRTREKLRRIALLTLVVLAGNFVGGLAFAAVVSIPDVFSSAVHEAFAALGREALDGSFLVTFVRGVLAGWLIALMVWMLPAASNSEISVVIIMTYLVGIAHLSHVIVGSIEIFYLVLTGQSSVPAYLAFFFPALIGNVLGGFILVTWLNHGQVVSGNGHRK
jgi:formate/nitrite transporter FocA (FNT family)